MIQAKVKILSNIKAGPNYYRMTLACPAAAKKIKPGQFFQVRCGNKSLDPFLRRPFSVHNVDKKGNIEILYQTIGKATVLLSDKKSGDALDIIGPLGNGFEQRTANSERRTSIIVAGGMGVAPMLFLAERLVHRRQTTDHRKVIVLIGAKNKKNLLCEKEFRSLGCDVKISTDDGSKGKKGFVTDALKGLLNANRYTQNATLYACGPSPMLEEIAKIAAANKIESYGSFEEHMACGMGNCYGCVVKTKKGYKRICKDGPVFDLGEIEW